MAIKEPTSMDDLFYFTNRTIENGGWIKAWVYKPEAPSGKGILQKPRDPKTGRPKVRATFYVDDEGTEYPREDIDPTLEMQIKYKSPHTQKEGEAIIPYKKKTWQGCPAYVFEDQEGNKIGVTKRMKIPKKKK